MTIKIMTGMMLAVSLLTACDSRSSDATSGDLAYQTIEFHKQGGKDCTPNGDTPSNDVICAVVHLAYPQINNLDGNPATTKINQFIQTELLAFESEDGKTPQTAEELANLFINDYLKIPNIANSWSLERRLNVVFATAKLITLRFSEFSHQSDPQPASGQTFYLL